MQNANFKNILIGLFFIIASLSAALGDGFAAVAFNNEEYIVYKLNQIRINPLGYAEALGYNRASLLGALPWLASFEDSYELPMATNFLNQKAEALNSNDPLVVVPVPRLDSDYAFTGDIGGVVSFINYMNPGTALDIIIHNQFAKELSPLYEGKRYILSDVFSLFGVSFRGGRTITEKGSRNAYFISICFGSALLKSELQVMNLINQMRAMPFETALYLGLNTRFLPGNYQPLFLNNSLQLTAKKGLSLNIDFPAYAQYFGFSGLGVLESSVINVFPETGLNTYALWIYSSLILNELKTYSVKNAIFNPANNEMGISQYYINGLGNDFFKLTVVTGSSPKKEGNVFRVYGVVFTDTDKNGIYTPGEELPDRIIEVYTADDTHKKINAVVSNNAGQFDISLPGNIEYRIETGSGKNRIGKNVILGSNQFFNLVAHE